MAITKMTADTIKARASRRNRAKIEATTEDDIRRQMIEDGEKPDEEVSERDIISPWYIRKRLGMSQREFANTLGVPVATLRNWEQNRVAMEPATIALMCILAREPEAALRALRGRAA
jgi:putative transcriptional regulator